MDYEFLAVRREGPVEYLTLNRPRVRTAFNSRLVRELAGWAAGVRDDRAVRVVVLGGAGPVFCAGGDLSWLGGTADGPVEDNRRDARDVAAMLDAFDRLPMPLVGRIHGAAIGGGAGLTAACDIAVAEEATVFSFPEVRHGIVPSVITPYVLAKIGRSAARELFLTGARFGAGRAREIGLVHAVVPAATLDGAVQGYVAELLAGAPEAVRSAKAMIARVWPLDAADAAGITADALATCRVSAEAQEGMRAFLEKRKPRWLEPA
jgi:methylglutaconyl-CoA hydratase